MPSGSGAQHHVVDPERVHRGRDADDVHDGVMAAQLVQMDGGRIGAVDARFDLCDRPQCGDGARRHRLRRGRRGQRDELGGPAFGRVVGDADVDAGTGQTVVADALGGQLPAGQAGGRDGGPDLLQRGARVQEGGEQHVPGQAGEGVDPADHRRSSSTRASRWAAMAAPNPESMLTTVIPAAQEVSIASSAVTPSRAAP